MEVAFQLRCPNAVATIDASTRGFLHVRKAVFDESVCSMYLRDTEAGQIILLDKNNAMTPREYENFAV
jgi:hypothetical protein